MTSATKEPTLARAEPAPADCRSMADVRAGVDKLDRQLVALLSTRQAYMEAAARIKPDRSLVRDPDRIEDVVAKVLAHAGTVGLARDIAEPVWRTLIERCIAHEYEVWDRERADGDVRQESKRA